MKTQLQKSLSRFTLLAVAALVLFVTSCKKDEECNQPGTLTVSNVTGTSAQLNWVAASPAPEGYDWQVVPTGNQPGTGTITSGTATATTAQATGLTATTNYDFYVRSSCDGSASGWAGPGAFTTLAGGTEPPIYLCDSFPALTTPLTLVDRPNAPVDYVIDCNWRIGSDLVIEPGVVIEMDSEAGMYTVNGGSIKAVGTSTNRITIRGTTQQKGHWLGIAYSVADLNNEFSYVDISDAGSSNVIQGGPVATFYNASNGSIKFSNNNLSNGLAVGYMQALTADVTGYANNTITTHDDYPLQIHANDFSQLDGTGSSYTGNAKDMINMTLTGGSVITVTTSQTWQNPGVPVVVAEGNLGIYADLVIEPGFEMICPQDFAIKLDDSGTFNAEGTSTEPIIFRGEQNIQGYWIGIYLDGTSVLNKLDYVTISDAGREKQFGAAPAKANLYISAGTSNLVVSNSTISNSLECGIYTSNAGVTLTNVTYNNNAGNDVCP